MRVERTAAGPPEGWGKGQGRPDDVISGVGVYKQGARALLLLLLPLLKCPNSVQ